MKYNVDPEIAYQLMHKDNGKSLAKAMDPARVQSLIMSSRLPDADDWPALADELKIRKTAHSSFFYSMSCLSPNAPHGSSGNENLKYVDCRIKQGKGRRPSSSCIRRLLPPS
jgi:hypothetical protein